MNSKAAEAAASNERQNSPTPAPRPSLQSPPQPPPPTPSPPTFLRPHGNLGVWPEHGRGGVMGVEGSSGVVGVGGGGERTHTHNTLRQLARTNLVMASIIFVSQLVLAGCLCRPVVVMGGLWLGVLVLVQAVLTLRASTHAAQPAPPSHSAHALLVGSTWVSGVVSVVCLGGAAYLFSGHLTLACVSAFHRPDHASVVRLYIVEVVGLVASLPCLTAAIVSFISTALSARAAYPPKAKPAETPVVLYLPRWGEAAVYGSNQQTLPLPQHHHHQQPPTTTTTTTPNTGSRSSPHSTTTTITTTTPAAAARNEVTTRNGTPPPSYHQVAEESYA
ncbi:hypothetical protein Pcinc_024041 [Petrolisthes cinctipes]|uniref:Uncharacterized protein n=1 Tax=Petrolisthes cinctipes TaxID=88211 RepID=A0AAE1FBD4_PETCI|nr:hypothetical protein Pcinc_024041 [Petrolisthes cinctipes]